MSSDYTDKDTFFARHGSAEHIDSVIRGGIEPMIRTVVKNRNFDQEHHRQLKQHRYPYVRNLAFYSPHVTKEDIGGWLRDPESQPILVGNAMQHHYAKVEDIKHVAYTHPLKNVVGAAINTLHERRGLTPEILKQVGNREFPMAPTPYLNIPAHIYNSVMPKDHAPITHNDIVKAHGGTLR